MIRLDADETEAIRRHTGGLPVGITPYYASLLDADDPRQGLRRTVVPVLGEYLLTPGEGQDPLGEDGHSPVPGLVHRYPDRVLLLVTNFCSVYCRYCTRARMVGSVGERSVKKADIEAALDYVAATPVIRDVLISGGDPLSLDEERLEYVLGRLRAIPHVEFVRIGSKQPVVQPMRITPTLTRMLKRFHPLWMSLHFTHPDELTPEVAEACGRLADAGIPLGSQTVLLKGVNDDEDTMKRLVHGLLRNRVKPYYLYQCDPIQGSSHFRTPAMPCRPSWSTRPPAAARFPWLPTTRSGTKGMTCCSGVMTATSIVTPIRNRWLVRRKRWKHEYRTPGRPDLRPAG
jgi:lysine 2,3-aminomutase